MSEHECHHNVVIMSLKLLSADVQVCKLENQGGSYISIVIVDKY